MMRRMLLSVAAAVVAVAAMSAASAGGAAGNGAAKPTLKIGLLDGLGTLDPIHRNAFTDFFYALMVPTMAASDRYPGDPKSNPTDSKTWIQNGIASSWRYVPAPRGSGLRNKRFEVTVRKGVRFADGTRLTGAVVKANFEYLIKDQPGYAVGMGGVRSVTLVL
jgi:peptide/nickel transport system substrate-binding protein